MIVCGTGKIYTQSEFIDYIDSLGFDIDDVKSILFNEEVEILSQKLRDCETAYDEQMMIADGLNSNLQCLVAEIESVSSRLKGNGNITKANAAKAIDNAIRCYYN